MKTRLSINFTVGTVLAFIAAIGVVAVLTSMHVGDDSVSCEGPATMDYVLQEFGTPAAVAAVASQNPSATFTYLRVPCVVDVSRLVPVRKEGGELHDFTVTFAAGSAVSWRVLN